jgi:hypothetical protein
MPTADAAHFEPREVHRMRYAAALGRVIEAYRQPASVRSAHARLLRTLVEEARAERVKATSVWAYSDDPIKPDDPALAQTDAFFGTIEAVAQGVAGTVPA